MASPAADPRARARPACRQLRPLLSYVRKYMHTPRTLTPTHQRTHPNPVPGPPYCPGHTGFFCRTVRLVFSKPFFRLALLFFVAPQSKVVQLAVVVVVYCWMLRERRCCRPGGKPCTSGTKCVRHRTRTEHCSVLVSSTPGYLSDRRTEI